MARVIASLRFLAVLGVVGTLSLASGCGSSATPPQAPTAAPKAAASPTSAPAKAAGQPIEFRMGSGYPAGDIYTIGLDKFAELVKDKSKGAISIRVFPQSLGAEQQLTESVMSGSVDMGLISNGNAGRFTNAFFIYDLPFLFKSYRTMLKYTETPIGQQLADRFDKDLGLKSLFVASAGGGRDIQTRSKLVKTPADMKGLKIRVVSTPIDLATHKAWGANPTPIDWAQTLSALQQGVVDGMALSTPFMLGSKSYESIKYIVHVDYQPVFEQVYMNAKKFAALSPEHQKILLEAAREAGAWQQEEGAKMAASTTQELAKLGIPTYEPTPDEYAQWASIREKVWQDVTVELKDKIDLELAKKIYASQ